MERSTSQGKLMKSATVAAAIKVHSNGEPPVFQMRLIRVFKLEKETNQRRFFQVLRTGGCLFYGNDALRRRGGCCICLLMASGLTAKRFSIWVADADQGKFIYTLPSKRLKLAVFLILPRFGYTLQLHRCASQSEMDDKRGGHENTKTDFLKNSVRRLSRLYVGKTNGEEIWKDRPPDYPEHMNWTNPTSPPKDSTEKLKKRYQYLRSKIPNEKLTPEEQKAFEDFENDNMDSVKSFMRCNKWTDQIDNMRSELHYLQPSDLILMQRNLTLLQDQLSSLLSSPIASSSTSILTPTTTSLSSTLSRKRKDSRIPAQSKRSKTEMSTYGNCILKNNTNQRNILPKPTSQTAHNPRSTVFAPITFVSQPTIVESPVRATAIQNKSLWSLVSSNNRVPNTTNLYYTQAADATNSQPFMAASSLGATNTHLNHYYSHEALQKIPTSSSVSILPLSQESYLKEKTVDIKIDEQELNDSKFQAILLSIERLGDRCSLLGDDDVDKFMESLDE